MHVDEREPPGGGLAPSRGIALVLSLITAEMVSIFEGSMIYASMRAFYRQFGDPIAVGWILTAFLLASAATAPVLGRLADMYGRRRVALIVLSFSIVGSLIGGLSGSIGGVVLGRAFQGCTSAILPISYGLLREHLTRNRAVSAIGIVATVMTVGGGVGMLAGGVIVDHLSWRWIFYLSSALAALALFLVAVFVPRAPALAKRERVDVPGALMLALGVSALLFSLSSAKALGWFDQRVLLSFAAGIATLVVWAGYELRVAHPMVDLRLLCARQPALANLAMMMIGLGPLQAVSFLTLLMQQPAGSGAGLGVSASASGLMLFTAQCAGLVGGPAAARLVRHRSARVALLTGTTLLLAGWCGIALFHGSAVFLVGMLMLACAGQAIAMAAVPVLILDSVPPARTSEATATITTLRPIAMGTGIQLASLLIAGSLVHGPAHGKEAILSDGTFTLLFGCVAGACMLGVACALLLSEKRGEGADFHSTALPGAADGAR